MTVIACILCGVLILLGSRRPSLSLPWCHGTVPLGLLTAANRYGLRLTQETGS